MQLQQQALRLRLHQMAGHIKGECTLLVAGCNKMESQPWEIVRKQIRTAVTNRRDSLSEIARQLAAQTGISKNKIYNQALKIKKELKNG